MIRLVLILFLGVITACNTRHALTKEALNAYVLDDANGLRKTIEKEGVTIEVIYRPKELVIAQEAGTDDVKLWEETASNMDSLDYFIFKLSKKGQEIENAYAGDPTKYTAVTNYLSNTIAQDIRLNTEQSEVAPENLIFVPSFGASDASSLLIVFKSSLGVKNGDISIIFNDSMFGTGQNKFDFDLSNIHKTPQLKRQ